MKKSMINKNTFLRKFKKISDNFCQKLEKYIADSNDENIHDIRVSIRRLETSYKILPKNIRKQKKMKSYLKQAKKLFKMNAQIRDFDIICANMESKYPDKTQDLVESLRDSRVKHIKNANRLAVKISCLPSPKILKSSLKESKLEKKYLKVLDSIMLNIQKNTIIALRDEKKIDELHMLRKDFKKLRYSLEILSDKKTISETLKNLKNIQDMLGEIHDKDMIIDYLRSIEKNSRYSDIISAEVLERTKKYNEFVAFFRKYPKASNFDLEF
ncbi:MAG: CHAD domain-containing protein [Thaumarchaeota archaeon]|nr:CHAD domain-containing protein [Nitrososphaerota archaeon]